MIGKIQSFNERLNGNTHINRVEISLHLKDKRSRIYYLLTYVTTSPASPAKLLNTSTPPPLPCTAARRALDCTDSPVSVGGGWAEPTTTCTYQFINLSIDLDLECS